MKRTYQITPEIVIETGRAHYRATLTPRSIAVFSIFALLVGVSIAILYQANSLFEYGVYIFSTIIMSSIIAVIICGVVYIWWIPKHTVRNYNLQKSLHYEVSASWDDREIIMEASDGHSRLQYADIAFWLRAGDHIMLYRSEALYHVIAAEAFMSLQECDEMIATLTAAGVKKR